MFASLFSQFCSSTFKVGQRLGLVGTPEVFECEALGADETRNDVLELLKAEQSGQDVAFDTTCVLGAQERKFLKPIPINEAA